MNIYDTANKLAKEIKESKEYKEYRKMSLCPSYAEMQDLCTALNAVAKYAGYSKVTPSSFVNDL